MQEMNEIEPDLLPGGGGGERRGVLRISSDQVTGMIEWEQKSKLQKIPAPKFNPPKISCRISEPQKFSGQKALNDITRK